MPKWIAKQSSGDSAHWPSRIWWVCCHQLLRVVRELNSAHPIHLCPALERWSHSHRTQLLSTLGSSKLCRNKRAVLAPPTLSLRPRLPACATTLPFGHAKGYDRPSQPSSEASTMDKSEAMVAGLFRCGHATQRMKNNMLQATCSFNHSLPNSSTTHPERQHTQQ